MASLEEIYQELSGIADDIRESVIGNLKSVMDEAETQAARIEGANGGVSSTLTELYGQIMNVKDRAEELVTASEHVAQELENWTFGS